MTLCMMIAIASACLMIWLAGYDYDRKVSFRYQLVNVVAPVIVGAALLWCYWNVIH